jgi:hypothetical protein
MGRPKASNLRDVQLKLNLTAAEYECIVRRADAIGMRPVYFSRALVLVQMSHQHHMNKP